MTECSDTSVRDVLPDFMHGALDDDARNRVRGHLDGCEACATELSLLYQVLRSAPTPVVDVTRITVAIAPYRRRRWQLDAGVLRLAAAFVIAAAGVSALAVTRQRWQQTGPTVGVRHHPALVPVGVALVSVGEVSDEHLQQLIADMDQLEATPPENPEPVMPGGEGLGL